MKTYRCTDGMADVDITAETPQDAADEYVFGGDWGEGERTVWIDVRVTEIDDDGEEIGDTETIQITLEPNEPECADGYEEHDWQSPHEVVGGLTENPGVYGHGGGVTIDTVCAHCGKYCHVDTWAQNAENGKQGLDSVSYRDADDESLAWVASLQSEDDDDR